MSESCDLDHTLLPLTMESTKLQPSAQLHCMLQQPAQMMEPLLPLRRLKVMSESCDLDHTLLPLTKMVSIPTHIIYKSVQHMLGRL